MIESYFNIKYQTDPGEALSTIDETCHQGPANYICVADGNILSMVHYDRKYRKVIAGALFSIMDSSWVPIFVKRIYGKSYPQYNGSMIFDDIINLRKYRMYFLGGSSDVLEKLKDRLSVIDSRISGMCFEPLPFCSVDEFDYEVIANRINEDSPDIIWLSLGAPKQEQFASKLCPYLKHGIIIPVGAVFKFRSGVGEKRAPEWLVKSHLEFTYRILSDPSKQIKRCRGIIKSLPPILKEERGRSKMALKRK